jgi:hypothetical protein
MGLERDRKPQNLSQESGFALLIALIALTLLSVLGMYLSLAATAEVRISDNYESYVQARAAALAGLSHARALMRGLRFDDLLQGPDGAHGTSAGYLARARTPASRTPIDWTVARMLDIQDPSAMLAGLADDGTMSTGKNAAGNGVDLIPPFGIAQAVTNPHGDDTVVVSRYFVKVSDNNGEASEIAGDPDNDPFHDGDGQIIVRSMGVAQTFREETQGGARKNSLVVFEARFKHMSMFELDSPLVVQGTGVECSETDMFGGSHFEIQGGAGNYGISTIDANSSDGVFPSQQISARLTAQQGQKIQGAGQQPSVLEISAAIRANVDKKLLLDGAFVSNFMAQTVPRFADSAYFGSQTWMDAAPAQLGHYDPSQPQNAPGQTPKLTYVNGDLSVDGNLEGAGLLVVTGRFTATGNLTFCGLILVIGAGELDIGGTCHVTGAVYVARLSGMGEGASWGVSKLTVKDSIRLDYDKEAVKMAVSLLPPLQLSFREITSIIDP